MASITNLVDKHYYSVIYLVMHLKRERERERERERGGGMSVPITSPEVVWVGLVLMVRECAK